MHFLLFRQFYEARLGSSFKYNLNTLPAGWVNRGACESKWHWWDSWVFSFTCFDALLLTFIFKIKANVKNHRTIFNSTLVFKSGDILQRCCSTDHHPQRNADFLLRELRENLKSLFTLLKSSPQTCTRNPWNSAAWKSRMWSEQS